MKIQSKLIVNRSAYKTNLNEISKIISEIDIWNENNKFNKIFITVSNTIEKRNSFSSKKSRRRKKNYLWCKKMVINCIKFATKFDNVKINKKILL